MSAMDDSDVSALRASFAAVLSDLAASAELHRHIDSGDPFSAALRMKAAELGWFGLTAPEACGGVGLGLDAAAALYKELGRCAAPLPMLGALIAVQLIAAYGDESLKAAWLPRLAAGEVLVGVAAGALSPPWDDVKASIRVGGLRLHGAAPDLLDGAAAELFLVAARDESGAPIWALTEPGALAAIEPVALVDRTRSLASLKLEGAAAGILPGNGDAIARDILQHASIALACDSVGGARAILERTIDYLKTREQFGKPIGSFQALKHRCAEHAATLEAAEALVEDAVACWAGGEARASLAAALAKATACDVYATIATDAVQLHGGIGFTWEHDCHVYLKRAKLNQVLFGGTPAHRDHAARLMAAA